MLQVAILQGSVPSPESPKNYVSLGGWTLLFSNVCTCKDVCMNTKAQWRAKPAISSSAVAQLYSNSLLPGCDVSLMVSSLTKNANMVLTLKPAGDRLLKTK